MFTKSPQTRKNSIITLILILLTTISFSQKSHIEFDGKKSVIVVNDNQELDLQNDFSIQFWMQTLGTNKLIFSKIDPISETGYFVTYTVGKEISFKWKDLNGNGSEVVSYTNFPASTWVYITITFDKTLGDAKIYINGLDTQVEKRINDIIVPSSTALFSPIANNANLLIGLTETIANTNNPNEFKGKLDEFKIWDTVLSTDQIRFMMNQEVKIFGANGVQGDVIPNYITRNDISDLNWSNLILYFNMNEFINSNNTVVDQSFNASNGALVDFTNNYGVTTPQTAPLPYVSGKNGNWDSVGNWEFGTVQEIPNTTFSLSGVDYLIDWNIVKLKHDVSVNRNVKVLGLLSEINEFSVLPDNSLAISHYLDLDGVIDLDEESQLIQEEDSDLEVNSFGYLERDQQGTESSYNYNYWSSPVSQTNSKQTAPYKNNVAFTISDILRDGTNDVNPLTINFNNSYKAADAAINSPITISNYWIWGYNNRKSGMYSEWQHLGNSKNVNSGDGYTMKGTTGMADITDMQNYVFKGKPNNGTITTTIDIGNEYLVGNPYASAIDANEFIKDNLSNASGGNRTDGKNIINGALYYWDHFQEKTHFLDEYVGGYSTYTLMGATPAIASDTLINDNGAISTKLPGRYIPVAQGFFVGTILDASLTGVVNIDGGDITFKNSQRVFQTESGNSSSQFMKSSSKVSNNESEDKRVKIRLQFDSPLGLHRQLLLGEDSNTTSGFDLGYDAVLADQNPDDMYWMLNKSKLVIQAINNIDKKTSLPIGLVLKEGGLCNFKITSLENVSKQKIKIYLKDNLTKKHYELTKEAVSLNLPKGEINNRFEIVFNPNNSKNQFNTTGKSTENELKIWLNFDLPSGYNRQILIGECAGTTCGFDFGYDAPLAGSNPDDAYWFFDEGKYVIQGVPLIDNTQSFGIGLKAGQTGLLRVNLDDIQNDVNNIEIYIKDNTTGETFDIKNNIFETTIEEGEHNDRYSIVFEANSTLSLDKNNLLSNKINTFVNQKESVLNINKSADITIENIALYNTLGQQVQTWNNNIADNNIELPINVKAGVYFVNIKTDIAKISNKIIVQ